EKVWGLVLSDKIGHKSFMQYWDDTIKACVALKDKDWFKDYFFAKDKDLFKDRCLLEEDRTGRLVVMKPDALSQSLLEAVKSHQSDRQRETKGQMKWTSVVDARKKNFENF